VPGFARPVRLTLFLREILKEREQLMVVRHAARKVHVKRGTPLRLKQGKPPIILSSPVVWFITDHRRSLPAC
jgi:hypothetical protein